MGAVVAGGDGADAGCPGATVTGTVCSALVRASSPARTVVRLPRTGL